MQFVVPVALVGNVVVLANQHAVAGEFIHHGTQFFHQLVQARLPHLEFKGLVPHISHLLVIVVYAQVVFHLAQLGQVVAGGVVGQIFRLVDGADGVQAEAVHTHA